jgi:hypothetical protein
MRLIAALLCVAVLFAFVSGVNAADEKTLTGKITCAKCDLKKEKACATVIVAKDGDKDVVYYFDTDSSKKYHKEICTEGKDGKVTGTVSEKDGKHTIKVSKVEFK